MCAAARSFGRRESRSFGCLCEISLYLFNLIPVIRGRIQTILHLPLEPRPNRRGVFMRLVDSASIFLLSDKSLHWPQRRAPGSLPGVFLSRVTGRAGGKSTRPVCAALGKARPVARATRPSAGMRKPASLCNGSRRGVRNARRHLKRRARQECQRMSGVDSVAAERTRPVPVPPKNGR